VEIPPTPTPASTPTIDPTLAAAFIPPENATRLPTLLLHRRWPSLLSSMRPRPQGEFQLGS